jgi:hypothetical protein
MATPLKMVMWGANDRTTKGFGGWRAGRSRGGWWWRGLVVGRDPLPRLGMMVARAAGRSRSGLRPALRAPLTRLS